MTGVEETRTEILRAARELFVEQGFVQTTMQQLADQAGISKGAVYLHFRSKTEVLTALMRRLEEQVLERVHALEKRQDLDPVAKLREQLRLQFTEVREQRLLFESCLADSGVELDGELALVAQKARIEWQHLQERFVANAFPSHDPRFLTDIAVCLNGALNEYYTYVLLEDADIDSAAVADLLVAQTEALVSSLSGDDLLPVLDRSQLLDEAEIDERLKAAAEERIEAALGEIEAHAERLGDVDGQEVRETVEALRHAMAQEPRSRVMLQGLLANLRDVKKLSGPRKALAHELGLKLI